MASEKRQPRRAPHEMVDPWLEWADRAIYLVIAVLFLFAAAAMGGYAVVNFVRHMRHNFSVETVTFINGLLLVLIILEVLGTVRSYLSSGATSLKPFLYIGIISATRRILSIGAQTTLGEATNATAFDHQMIDLGANGGIVLALAVALFLFGQQELSTRKPGSTEPASDERWQ